MREIKFRAWDSVLGMRPVAAIDFLNGIVRVEGEGGSGYGGLYSLSIENSPPLEYTGLEDKNGREIYEGDILFNNWQDIYGKQLGQYWVVHFGEYDDSDLEYGSPGCGFYCDSQNDYAIYAPNGLPGIVEVIGNIYENPELCASPTSSTSAPPA